jgi:hypothetical protein
MATKVKQRAYRLLMVTFDLTETTPGDPRYRQADAALRGHGDLFRPVKQTRLLLTQSTSQRVKASLDQRLGRQTSILIAPLKSLPAWRIFGSAKRREWRNFVDAAALRGVEVQYLTKGHEGGA